MSAERLYTPQVLALAVELAAWPANADLPLHGQARSPTCGSTLAMDLAPDADGRIASLGMQVRACAIGQASAAIFARHATGRSAADIALAHDRLRNWLGGHGALPDWPELDLIANARAYPARHGAILLPWIAAKTALSTASADG